MCVWWPLPDYQLNTGFLLRSKNYLITALGFNTLVVPKFLPLPMATYYFSRVSITMEDDYIKKMEYLYNKLADTPAVVYRKDYYKIIDLLVRKVGEKSFITGQMVKYEAEKSEETLSPQNKIEDVTILNALLARVRFIYDSNESLLIYEEHKSHIPKESFGERFYSILKAKGDLLPITITPITDTYTAFLQRLRKITQIKTINIRLQPSNPNNMHFWKKVDDRLKKDNITNYKEVLENKKEGQGVKVDKETQSKILMGEDGYGVTTARGLDKNGERITISTKDTELQAKTNITNKESIEDEIRELQAKTKEIKNKKLDVKKKKRVKAGKKKNKKKK